jgi:hypothetical protein
MLHLYLCPLNVAVEEEALLLHIWEDPGSDLVTETNHPDRLFMVLSVPPGKCHELNNQPIFQELKNTTTTVSIHILTLNVCD